MNYINLGKTDTQISRIGLGTWAIGGGPAWNRDAEGFEKQSIQTIQQCPSLGVNLIDTAPGYNFGTSERIVGKAITQANRNQYVVITKFGLVWKRKGALFNKVGDIQLYKNLSPESIEEEIADSLKRLNTDYIDIYMSHWQSVEPYKTLIRDTMKELNKLKSEGKIRGIGVANASVDDVKEYLKYGDIDIVQAKYSILDRNVEKELLPLCKEKQITLQAYSPLEQGLLSGTMPRDYTPVAAQVNKKWYQPKHFQAALDMMDSWRPLCTKYECTIANLALAWVLAQSDNLTLLSGATNAAQISENVKSANISLSRDDIDFMRESAIKADIASLGE